MSELVPFAEGAWRGRARPGLVAVLHDALKTDAPGTAFETEGGRGALRRIALDPESLPPSLGAITDLARPPHLVLRPYRRGGLVRHIAGEAFVLANRPAAELAVHARCEEAGLPVAPLAGAAWRRRGPLVYGVFATLELAARPLDTVLREAGPAAAPGRVCGALLRRLHDAGVRHPDLNVHNILVGVGGMYLIDFDKARAAGEPKRLRRAADLLRFRRSLEKSGHGLGYFADVLAGYGPLTIPHWLETLHEARGTLRRRS